MDVPITIGVFLALALSVYETRHHAPHAYFDSAIMLLAFLLAGPGARSGDAAQNPRGGGQSRGAQGRKRPAFYARRQETEDNLVLTPVAALAEGDCVLVRAGERIPADGVIESGASSVDESAITGETAGKPVSVGDNVYAGSINGDGALKVRVTAAGHAALIDEAARLIDAASAARSALCAAGRPGVALYAPMVHLAALGTGLVLVFLARRGRP